MDTKRRAIIVTIVLVAVVALAWAVDLYVSRTSAAAGTGYHVTVEHDGAQLRSFSFADLKGLGTRRVLMQGQYETGPPLLRVLKAAGVTQFTGVTIIGSGVLGSGGSGRLDLARSAIDNDVLLDLASRGTVKVCGPRITRDQRVRDIVKIVVR